MNLRDFETLCQQARQRWEALHRSPKPRITVGAATCGRSAGALEVIEAAQAALHRLKSDCTVMEVGCFGPCYAEPIVTIFRPGNPGIVYGNVTAQRVEQLIQQCLSDDRPPSEGALGVLADSPLGDIPPLDQTPLMRWQVRRVLRNCGLIDPTNLEHYLANGGYTGLVKALRMSPEEVIDEVRRAGLRGRGGAGFPTWRKWQFCAQAPSEQKYVVCNADEGDPGAFMNRSLIEGDPHAVLEGMLIAARAVGATRGYIYCRAEYPLALERLRTAIQQAEQHGLLGEDIFGSGFSFCISIMEGAGAFVCGEETALLASIEGRRGTPRPRPPFPAVSGLWGKPTVINNVETLASAALIMQNGADWFAQYGTEASKGTKTFSLVGKVKRTGLVEVPLGTTLRRIIFDIGGGIIDDRPFKAVQTGGPSGGCVPASLLDIPIDYDSLQAAGTIMGSGGLVVMDDRTCMVDVARYFIDFAQKESCGACVPCRLGTRQLLDILRDVTSGNSQPEDIELLEELALAIKAGSLCGLGQTAPNPVLTTLRYFRHEYEAHVRRKRCPAVVCRELVSSPCQHICPIGTEAPVYIALIAQGRYREAYEAIVRDNPLPSVCARVCHQPCEANCQAGQWGSPIAVRALKRFVMDRALAEGWHPGSTPSSPPAPPSGKKVAVVGAGPAGLMAGYRLARLGHKVIIFDALSTPGGALAACIPDYRLPKQVLQADIQFIQNAGVEFRTSVYVGRDVSWDDLCDQFDAVFVAAGAHKSRKLGLPNEDAVGVIDALEFLKQIKLGGAVEIGPHVGVVGGGNTAIDAARTARRMPQCTKVTLIYRRTRQEMPAFAEEIEDALAEGVEMLFLAAPQRILVADGKLCGLECVRTTMGEPDESGRRRPIAVEGSQFTIPLDTLLVAVGEEPDISLIGRGHRLTLSARGKTPICQDTLATDIPGVFAGGDAVTGPGTVLDAMAAGKLAAEMIDKYLRGQPLERKHQPTRPSTYIPPVQLTEPEAESAHRPAPLELPPEARIASFAEVEWGLTEEQAVAEARRCLRCDLQTQDAQAKLAAWQVHQEVGVSAHG